jgi:aminoglycoside phosphotransferase (APT) family kinase protein
MSAEELPLPGGNVGGAVRVGDTVRRATGPWTPAVHALLRHLETVGFHEAPRVLGIDDRGREILTYLEGKTVGDADPWPHWWRDDDTLVQAIGLLRRFHSEVATFEPPPDARWRFAGSGEPTASIVHGDWAPYNVVWRDGVVIGVIDWDLARPGDPLDDLAFAAWLWAPLHHPEMLARGEFGPWEDAERERRLRLLVDTYGLADRAGFAERIVGRMHSSADGIERGAAAGDEGMARLRSLGVIDDVRRSARWAEAHVGQLTAVLTS